MTETGIAAALQHMRPASQLTRGMAHGDLVQGIDQAEIAARFDRTKGTVSQASGRVWRGFLRSKGYKEVRVVLGDFRAWMAEGWGREAMDELNEIAKRPPRRPRKTPIGHKA